MTRHAKRQRESGIAFLEAAVVMIVLLPMLLGAFALFHYLGSNRTIDTIIERAATQSRAPLMTLSNELTVVVHEAAAQTEAETLVAGVLEQLAMFRGPTLEEDEYLVEVWQVVLALDEDTGELLAQQPMEPQLLAAQGELVLNVSQLEQRSIEAERSRLSSTVAADGASHLAVPLAGRGGQGAQYLPQVVALITRVYIGESNPGPLRFLFRGDDRVVLSRMRSHVYSGVSLLGDQ